MEIVRLILGVILPYVAMIVFVVGMGYRLLVWRKLASPPMTLFPAPADDKANTANIIKETLFFKSLFKGDRTLWILAWLFHAVLLLIFVGHFRVFLNVDAILLAIGMSEDNIHAMSSWAGGAAGVLILLMVALLLVRRMTVQRVREVTGTADYVALALIGIIIITGNMMRFGSEHFDLALTRSYFAALATFSNANAMEALRNNVFLMHMGLAFVLIILVPFSKLLHFGGFFFTHQLIRKQ